MTQTTLPRVASRPAPAALWRGLLDDAAVFPPGSTPWQQAVPRHLDHRQAWYAPMIGPLLLPGAVVHDLAQEPPERGFELGLIARPGTPLPDAGAALATARTVPGVEPVAAEIPWTEGWQEALEWGVPLAVEVRAAGDLEAQVREIAAAGGDVRAKLRTGATETIPLPTREQLAVFLVACATHGVGAKLTGGLHHALPTEGVEHGFLGVLLAASEAARGTIDPAPLVAHLAQADPATLADGIGALDDLEIAATRALLTGYGCCDVLDPVNELLALGLLEEGNL